MNRENDSVNSLGLSVRSRNGLYLNGVRTVGELLLCTEEKLMSMRNLGRKSVDEILAVIDMLNHPQDCPVEAETVPGEAGFDAWAASAAGRETIRSYLDAADLGLDSLEMLSARAYNQLTANGYQKLSQVLFLTDDELMRIPKMGQTSVADIRKQTQRFLHLYRQDILDYAGTGTIPEPQVEDLQDLLTDPACRDTILEYVRQNDIPVERLGLSARPYNQLVKNGYSLLSEFILLEKADFFRMQGMGTGSADAIMTCIRSYLQKHEQRLIAFCTGDESSLWSDDMIREHILRLYQTLGFNGLSLSEMEERLALPEAITLERLKHAIGRLLADGTLEYVDYRCYRVYPRFSDYLESCPGLDDRSKDFLQKRLSGSTLEEIAQEYGLTRERVRQVINKAGDKVQDRYLSETDLPCFDEDYYRYFYETYAFDKKEGSEWFGIPLQVYRYFDLKDVTQGAKSLNEALDDRIALDAGLRLRIANYLNRNRLFLDGQWVERERDKLEALVARLFCRDEVSYDQFVEYYNSFLQEQGVPFDEKIYYTEDVLNYRKNRLAESRFLFWKFGSALRYYPIDSQDYSELLDTLNLDAYENTELSTQKFMESYPQLMAQYDIRDQYELHNLLRKIVPDGSYHDFHCGKMPIICFGQVDRASAILDLIIQNAPLTTAELIDLVHAEYGFDMGVIPWTQFSEYLHNGVYSIGQKVMPTERKQAFAAALTEDFYFMEEIRTIFHRLFPDADPEELNAYNLKTMGFLVLSNYVVQNYPSMDAYFRGILTQSEILDIAALRKRYTYVGSFSQVLIELKKELEVLEFEPNQLIRFSRLEHAGITREMLRDYCDTVYAHVDEGAYFSVHSLRRSGFKSELDELGFSDWFYYDLLCTDERFMHIKMFNAGILYKGTEKITVASFAGWLVRRAGSIDVYDLMTELEEEYGCTVTERGDILYKLDGTGIYHDHYLDRLYATERAYERELASAEGI